MRSKIVLAELVMHKGRHRELYTEVDRRCNQDIERCTVVDEPVEHLHHVKVSRAGRPREPVDGTVCQKEGDGGFNEHHECRKPSG